MKSLLLEVPEGGSEVTVEDVVAMPSPGLGTWMGKMLATHLKRLSMNRTAGHSMLPRGHRLGVAGRMMYGEGGRLQVGPRRGSGSTGDLITQASQI